jgi:diaminopimelate decarboxylase
LATLPDLNLQYLKKMPPTPFYCYSEEHITSLLGAFRGAIKKEGVQNNFHWHYAIKANSNLRLLQYFKKNGAGVDIVSGGELSLALEAKFKASQIVFSGVGKSDRELTLAVRKNLGQINIESESEFERLARIAKSLRKTINYSIRFNPDVDAKTHPHISTGLWNHKFGVDAETALGLYKKYLNDPYLRATGLTMHIGSQLQNMQALKEAVHKAIDFVQTLKGFNIRIESFDMGGGLGVSYEGNGVLPDFDSYAKLVLLASNEWERRLGFKPIIISECGRALTAQAGFLVSQVIAIKTTPKKNFLIVDASMTELLRPALYQAKHAVKMLQENANSKKRLRLTSARRWDIVGPVCESSDVLASNVELPPIAEGDFIVIEGAGAYGVVMASTYNARALPKEYWLSTKGVLKKI